MGRFMDWLDRHDIRKPTADSPKVMVTPGIWTPMPEVELRADAPSVQCRGQVWDPSARRDRRCRNRSGVGSDYCHLHR